eukprot:superscaffoldBa00003166_g16287
MANNSTNTTEDAELEVAFPHDLYTQASKASVGERLGFIVQILEQTAALFEESHNSTSWEEKTVEDFLNVVTQQADGLRSCNGSHSHKKNKKLQMYFKRLSGHILGRMANNSTNTTEDAELEVAFPHDLYTQASKASNGSNSHKKNKKLQMYFKRLSGHILGRMGHSAEAWELIRREIKVHLFRADQLASSLLTTN